MSKRIITIIDTGLKETQAIERLWDGFEFYRHDLLGGGVYHEHGTLVGNINMLAWDTDEFRDKAEWHHIRAGNQNGQFMSLVLKEAFTLALDLKTTGMNNSWGASDLDLPELENPDDYQGIFRTIAEEYIQPLLDAGVVIHAAAGNSDDRQVRGGDLDPDVNYPWRLFNRGEVLVWGSTQASGFASDWSSDGKQLSGVFVGENLELKNASGEYVTASGTSFCSPQACAVWELDRYRSPELSAKNLRKLWAEAAVHLTQPSPGLWVDYVNPITGEKWHEKFGWGSHNKRWQKATAQSRSRPQRLRIMPQDRKIRYHDFRRI